MWRPTGVSGWDWGSGSGCQRDVRPRVHQLHHVRKTNDWLWHASLEEPTANDEIAPPPLEGLRLPYAYVQAM